MQKYHFGAAALVVRIVEPGDYEVGEGEAEDCCGVGEGAVDTCRAFEAVWQGFGAVYAGEFVLWEYARAAESCAQSSCERAAVDFPKFDGAYFCRVEFSSCAH